MAVISLTTDFGHNDWFVGTMKGVVLRINPAATLVDITHAVPPGDIRAGAFALAASYRFFAPGAVHVVVVDPGVGSDRKAIAIQTRDYIFVGPDNGVLSWAVRGERIIAIRQLENESYFLLPLSQTFHGRDVFASVAAHLSLGVRLSKLGRELPTFIRVPWPEPRSAGSALHGEVVYVDRFGNCITNIPAEAVSSIIDTRWVVLKGRTRLCAVASCYAQVPEGCAVAVPGSSGYLEIAVNGGNASRQLALKPGAKVKLRPVR